MWSIVKESPAALFTFISLWVFSLFPSLRPWQPPEVQGLTISNVVVAERRHVDPTAREEFTVMFFNVDVVGYDRREIQVATVWIDALTLQRVDDLIVYRPLSDFTRTDRSVAWLNVPYPMIPPESLGCLFVRVLLFEFGESQSSTGQVITDLSDQDFLAYGDSVPFEPYEDGACSIIAASTPAVS